MISYLPNRQLRNMYLLYRMNKLSYLPNRQLRNHRPRPCLAADVLPAE